jgi:hypothetical protein
LRAKCCKKTIATFGVDRNIHIKPIEIALIDKSNLPISMPDSASARRSTATRIQTEEERPAAETAAVAPWLSLVAEKVRTMHYGVVQIVIHDSKVVQIERTERTRFDAPQSVTGR